MAVPRKRPSPPSPVPSGGLAPVPPRRNLRLTKDSVRETLAALSPEEAADLLRRVDLEHSREPMLNSAEPYVEALREMQADKRNALFEAAGQPESLRPAMEDMTVEQLLAEPPSIEAELQGLNPSQQAAYSKVLELAESYEQARQQYTAKFAGMEDDMQFQAQATMGDPTTAFDTSPFAQAIRAEIEQELVLNGLEGMLGYNANSPVSASPMSELLSRMAPTLSQLPEATGTRNYRASRADFPQEDKMSTYMGSDQADNYRVPDEGVRGRPAAQFMQVAGREAKDMLLQAGWTEKQISQFSPEQIYGLVSLDPDGVVGPDGQTHSVAPRVTGDPAIMRSPAQKSMEFWLSEAGKFAGNAEIAALDGGDQRARRLFTPQRKSGEVAEPPSFAYHLMPEVDADGNVTNPNRPMSGDQAARMQAYALGAQDPSFATDITDAMQKSIDTHWSSFPDQARKEFRPSPTGLKFLQEQARMRQGIPGGGTQSGSLNIETQTRAPRVDDARAPSLEELAAMDPESLQGMEVRPPDSPPPMPEGVGGLLRELENMPVEGGNVDDVLGPSGAPPVSLDDINSMLDIPVDDDTTGFLGMNTMNRMQQPQLLASLLA